MTPHDDRGPIRAPSAWTLVPCVLAALAAVAVALATGDPVLAVGLGMSACMLALGLAVLAMMLRERG